MLKNHLLVTATGFSYGCYFVMYLCNQRVFPLMNTDSHQENMEEVMERKKKPSKTDVLEQTVKFYLCTHPEHGSI